MSNVEGWGSPLGFSATNMRYVTITKSRFYNNAAGIVPNALDSEKFPPPEDNVIIDNDIFWNNFNYHQGKPPFAVRENTTAALVPVGTGVLLLGGRGNRIENNRIHGNFLAGVAAIEGILLVENPDAKSLERNVVRNNQFGLNGTDTNGNDLMYDGNGSDNCFSLDGVNSTFPADRSTFAGCGGPNAFSKSVQDADARLHRRGRAQRVGQARRTPRRRATRRSRSSSEAEGPDRRPRRRRAHQRGAGAGRGEEDRHPRRQLLRADDAEGEARHDGHVALARVRRRAATSTTSSCATGPKGVKKFHSEAASTDYTFKRKLTVPGTYRIVCTLHEEMRMTVKVRK